MVRFHNPAQSENLSLIFSLPQLTSNLKNAKYEILKIQATEYLTSQAEGEGGLFNFNRAPRNGTF